MLQATEEEVLKRIAFDNPWWSSGRIADIYDDFPHRSYFDAMMALMLEDNIRRAIVLMGSRRVGKTVMMHQSIQWLIQKRKVLPRNILYVSLDTPTYSGMPLDAFVGHLIQQLNHASNARLYIFFYEIFPAYN